MRDMPRRRRACVERWIATFTAFLAIGTAVWPAWIEGLTGFDPDRRRGWFELLLVIGLALTSACSATAAYVEHRRAVPST